MTTDHLSLILLPTLQCNADCEYCFEDKRQSSLSLEQLSYLIEKVVDHMVRDEIKSMTIYWQGGEVMTLSPVWFEQAHEIITRIGAGSDRKIENELQSNLIGYDARWNNVIAKMFGNNVGSSLDYPNLYRRSKHGTPAQFNEQWLEKYGQAREAGIEVGVISIPNRDTLKIGAADFYSYFVDEAGITSLQVNTPFPGGKPNSAKEALPLPADPLGRFLVDLADIWIKRGYGKGVQITPFDELIDFFTQGEARLPCIWQDSCSNGFICIDPEGNVSQCDCWVTSYPAHRFGNLFENPNHTDLLQHSRARQRLKRRPGILIQKEDCIQCDYLAICHGGCAIRTFTTRGELNGKDPYCETYKILFAHMESIARSLAGRRVGSS